MIIEPIFSIIIIMRNYFSKYMFYSTVFLSQESPLLKRNLLMYFQNVKDKLLVQKEILQNAEILIKNKVDFIILEVYFHCFVM